MFSISVPIIIQRGQPNETVEKPFFAGRNTPEGAQKARFGGQNAPGVGISIAWRLLERPKSVDFPDIARLCDQCEQSPLYIHFRLAA
jgi:hypothetical protein